MDIYSLRLNWDAPIVGVMQNVLHYQTDTVPAVDQRTIAEALIDQFVATVMPDWLPLISPTVGITSLSARRMNDTGGPTFTIIFEAQGSGAGPVETTGIAMDIALAPVTFPWQPGHIYIGGIPQGMIADNSFDPAFVNNVQTLCNKLKLPLVLGGGAGVTMQQVIWSRKTRTARKIQEWVLRPKPSALNRRLQPYP